MKNVFKIGIALAATATALTPIAAQAQFPERRVEIVVPWTAGGTTHAHVQLLAEKLESVLGTNVVVRNLAGAAGTIGTAEVAMAEADGYTLLATPAGPTTIQPHLRSLPYALESFDLVCRYTNNPIVVMVNQDSEYQSMDDFVAAAKAAPGDISFATAGVGTLPHVVGLALDQGLGIELLHLPTSSAADSMRALLGEQVDMMPETLDHLARYDVRGIAVATEERVPEYPDIPTFKELGVDMVFNNWQALYVPTGTPADVQQVLADACVEAFDDQAIVEGMEAMNSKIDLLTGEDLQSFAASESETNRNLLVSAGLLPE